jgi:tetratricopeptide (TPR) repeat protein
MRTALLSLLFTVACVPSPALTQASTISAQARTSSIEVTTQPKATVWLDDVRRGITDDQGRLKIDKVKPGRHTLRIRATGFAERSLPVVSTAKTVAAPLKPTSDPAELAFQRAEEAREKARDENARKQAEELYREAIKLRPAFPAAHVGLARTLLDMNQHAAALAEIQAARKYRAVYPEASAVEGRIRRDAAYMDEAIAAFKRAIREGRGFQPEAHTGLALVYEEKGRYDEAADEFQTALSQLSDTEPILYQLLGAVYERQEKYKEAVAAYDKYLELAPNGNLAPAIKSIIEQLRRQANGEQLMP